MKCKTCKKVIDKTKKHIAVLKQVEKYIGKEVEVKDSEYINTFCSERCFKKVEQRER